MTEGCWKNKAVSKHQLGNKSTRLRRMSNPQFQITVYSPTTPVELGQPQTWRLAIRNLTDSEIPKQRLSIVPDSYYSHSSSEVPNIPAHGQVTVSITGQVTAHKNVDNLCPDITFMYGQIPSKWKERLCTSA